MGPFRRAGLVQARVKRVKVRTFLKKLREKTEDPLMLANIEKVASHSKTGRDRVKYFLRIAWQPGAG